ncbi:hypothetical protein [Metabacillus halosaccharovorans]|uniref:hypothetical protein n=1 Tax=Metabacillus halosaccharovorans TaxID=930124 RepID=UPI002042476D|nr:hypothetical protein [Metabacillus halosaccharovorans]MCM3444368.1 hypothetical protein [Metabacillus halosaccharovorans]
MFEFDKIKKIAENLNNINDRLEYAEYFQRYLDEMMDEIKQERAKINAKKQLPFLRIDLDDINSVPTVYYNGEEIKGKIRVNFDWKTRDCNDYYLPFIHVEYADANKELGYFGSKTIQHNQPIHKSNQLSDYTTLELLEELGERDEISIEKVIYADGTPFIRYVIVDV